MSQTILIYGATGYTGKLVAMQACYTHLSFEIAGRNGPQVTALADELDVPCRIFALDDRKTIIASLAGVVAMPEGPTLEARLANRACAFAEVGGIDGTVVRARIDTVNGYSYTQLAAVEALRLVVTGQFKPGFQTPATVFCAGFAISIADTRIIDMV